MKNRQVMPGICILMGKARKSMDTNNNNISKHI